MPRRRMRRRELVHWIRFLERDGQVESWCEVPGEDLGAFAYSPDHTTCLECLRKAVAKLECTTRLDAVTEELEDIKTTALIRSVALYSPQSHEEEE